MESRCGRPARVGLLSRNSAECLEVSVRERVFVPFTVHRTVDRPGLLAHLKCGTHKNTALVPSLSLSFLNTLTQVHYAVAAVRAQLVNCNTGLAAPELLHVLRDSKTEVLVRDLCSSCTDHKRMNVPADQRSCASPTPFFYLQKAVSAL